MNTDHKRPKESTPRSEISTSRKHSVDYATADGFILRTGYMYKRDWYLFPIAQGGDNCIDFLWKYYRGAVDALVSVDITKDDKLFHIKVRNSNYKNIPVFDDLKAIFDYDGRYGSKQDVHVISRGMLGDALKQIGMLGYVLLHAGDDGSTFGDKQWEYPLIIRHNKKELKVDIRFHKARQQYEIHFNPSSEKLPHSDTEIELVLPIIEEIRDSLDRRYIEKFCRKYAILTTDISFKFRVLVDDNNSSTTSQPTDNDKLTLMEVLSKTQPKAILKIDIPALHPIAEADKWSNADYIGSYTPAEFTSRITNVHDRQRGSTTLYDILLTFKGGNNIKKTSKTDISITELLASDPDIIYDRIEKLFKNLKEIPATATPEQLSLPYTTNRKNRVGALRARIGRVYDIDKGKEPSYRLERGFYDNSMVQYPYAFEIIAIPLDRPTIKQTEFLGAVNYSISPNNIIFDGNYVVQYSSGYDEEFKDIPAILSRLGFHQYNLKSRLACIVVGNLITPKRDPQGYDKSRLNIQPFVDTTLDALVKMLPGIQTYHGAGYVRQKGEDSYRNARLETSSGANTVKEALRQFLISERGLPG